MRLLAVPNWSFGRNRALLNRFRAILESAWVTTHFCESDVDHNRTVTAFSGEGEQVYEALLRLCDAAFDTIDLNAHVGVHPRIGALDVCPFVLLEGEQLEALALAEYAASKIASTYDVPVFLYEKTERGRHEADLPSLRKGGVGGLASRELQADFGPPHAHPRLGVVILGVRGFLIATNVNLAAADPAFAKALSGKARKLRAEGDERFLGVRSMGVALASKSQSQLSLNLTLPDLTPVDPIIEWAIQEAERAQIRVSDTELIGVIREKDVPTATRLKIKSEQIVRVA